MEYLNILLYIILFLEGGGLQLYKNRGWFQKPQWRTLSQLWKTGAAVWQWVATFKEVVPPPPRALTPLCRRAPTAPCRAASSVLTGSLGVGVGGTASTFEGRYPLPNYRPCFLACPVRPSVFFDRPLFLRVAAHRSPQNQMFSIQYYLQK